MQFFFCLYVDFFLINMQGGVGAITQVIQTLVEKRQYFRKSSKEKYSKIKFKNEPVLDNKMFVLLILPNWTRLKK